MRTLSEPQRATAHPTRSPSHIDFGIARNSTRTHPFGVLIASLSRLERRARLCPSTSLALADCNFASYAFGLSARHICLTPVEHPLNCKYRFVGRGRDTVPQSILRRSTCSANGRPFHKQLGHTGIIAARIPGFEYNLLCLETRTRRGRRTPSTTPDDRQLVPVPTNGHNSTVLGPLHRQLFEHPTTYRHVYQQWYVLEYVYLARYTCTRTCTRVPRCVHGYSSTIIH